MEAAALSLHYATTPRRNDEGPRFRQTFAKFRHQPSFAWRKSWGVARHTVVIRKSTIQDQKNAGLRETPCVPLRHPNGETTAMQKAQ